MATVTITDDNFEQEVLGADGAVLVDFWAEWCGPCKQLAPALEALSDELPNVKIAKVNIDQNPMSPTKYGVRSIPTMVLFKGGEVIDTKVGAHPKSALAEWLSSAA